jgi:hypothetical protein
VGLFVTRRNAAFSVMVNQSKHRRASWEEPFSFEWSAKKFMEVIECEEGALATEGVAPCTLMIEKIWDSKKFWFFYVP